MGRGAFFNAGGADTAADKPKLSWGQKVTQYAHNQQLIGKAYFAYAKDHDGKFPIVPGPAAVGGQTGDGMGAKGKKLPIIVNQLYGASVDEKKRPLNKYIANIKSFHCPADTGGGAYSVPSYWQTFGNSYQVQAGDDMFRVRHSVGISGEPKGSDEGKPITLKEIAKSPKNKIIQGDWNWPYDREDAWHGLFGWGQHMIALWRWPRGVVFVSVHQDNDKLVVKAAARPEIPLVVSACFIFLVSIF